MNKVGIYLELDEEMKNKFYSVCYGEGVKPSKAIKDFMNKVINEKALSFKTSSDKDRE